mmetsp:Transcript_22057/g.61790  ORF Transcript_22057/g.61790 Transcript_22057/m.61790 type:complete len:147 (-) Transcript_22057:20-460(-)
MASRFPRLRASALGRTGCRLDHSSMLARAQQHRRSDSQTTPRPCVACASFSRAAARTCASIGSGHSRASLRSAAGAAGLGHFHRDGVLRHVALLSRAPPQGAQAGRSTVVLNWQGPVRGRPPESSAVLICTLHDVIWGHCLQSEVA